MPAVLFFFLRFNEKTATAHYEDEIAELEEHGVDEAFNLNTEAGQGYAHLVRKLLR